MITIGIISVFDKELSAIKSKMEMVTGKNIVGNDFFIGKMHSMNIVLVRPKIGKVNAAITAQVLIDLYGVDYIINLGLACKSDDKLKNDDIVISSEFIHHDMDTTVFGYKPGVIPELTDFNKTYFLGDEVLIKCAKSNASKCFNSSTRKVYTGRIASGDQYIYDNDVKFQIKEIFMPYCIDMEGTSIAQTCYLNKIPFVSIYSIYNPPTDKAIDFNNYIFETYVDINKIVLEMIKEL